MPSDYERIKAAIEYVRTCASKQPTLMEIADAVSLSPPYLQRLFRRWAGVSPKRWLQYLNATDAKRLLRDSVPVLDAAFAVGLSGPGRLHDLVVSTVAVTPGEYAEHGAGVEIQHGWHETPFGQCLIGLTERGICALRFSDGSQTVSEFEHLKAEWSNARFVQNQKKTAEVIAQIFAGRGERKLLLDLRGTNFQLRVWEALLRIPESCVTTYGDLAQRLGVPTAGRAVANAIGANPIGILIPCHRVLRATGEIGGYRWGIERKKIIISHEMLRSSSMSQKGRNERSA